MKSMVTHNDDRIPHYPFSGIRASAIYLAIIASLSPTHTFAQQTQLSQTEAQPGDIEENEPLERMVIIGSRMPNRSVTDMSVPVDLIGRQQMEATGQSEVGRMLQSTAPSFNFSSSVISDGTDSLRPATLRGLGPDQTLVLINGKRRHQGALIHINYSVGRGTAGTDLNAIPAAAIRRIEVLRDGASAQYGSDAIAGVINIVLNDDASGQVFTQLGQNSKGDGQTIRSSFISGHEFEDGFVNLSMEYNDRDSTNRTGISGACQYLAGCDDTDGNGIPNAQDPREIHFDRKNFKIGDADTDQVSAVINAGWQLGDGELYGFATYSQRDTSAPGFYRRANEVTRNPTLTDGEAFAEDGFLPFIDTTLDDWSASIGYELDLPNDLTFELSLTSGENSMDYHVNDSVNASWVQQQLDANLTADEIRQTTPSSANAGELTLSLTTINLDMIKLFDGFSLAWGGEFRMDSYEIKAGEEYSYENYDPIEQRALAGIQVFPGYEPRNEVDEDRDVYSFYVDSEYTIAPGWRVSAALRYDDYDDFGSSTNYKVSTRYSLSEAFAIRAAAGSGFRAPSMQQNYFNNVSSQFANGQAGDVGTYRNDSQLAKDVGIPQLKEEESTNYSAGLTYTPTANLSVTVDYYHIDIDDRIVISEHLTAGLGSPSLDAALAANNVDAAQFFVNAANTETQGWDIVANYDTPLYQGLLNITLAMNFTETEVVDVFSPGGLEGIQPSDVFGEQATSIIESWQPEDRIHLQSTYQRGDFIYTLSINRFGQYEVIDNSERQTYGEKWLTDLRVEYFWSRDFSMFSGVNNLFDTTPEGNTIGQFREGQIEDNNGNIFVDSPGVFQYSRRSAPFGFNGTYYYVGMQYSF